MEDVYENLKLDIEYDAQNGIVAENYSARAEEIKQNRENENPVQHMDMQYKQQENTAVKHTDIAFSDEDKALIDIARNKAVSELSEIKKKAALAVENVTKDSTAETERQYVINYLRKQVEEEKNSLAANALAVLCFEAKDYNKAVEYFSKAVSLDDTNVNAVRNLAIALETTQANYDKEQVFNLYDKAAKTEDSIALNNLACCYLNGEGTERNVKKAVECFQKAAKLNDTLAMVNLGDMYSVGNGLHSDKKKAFQFYQMAAEQNNATALRRLGECYLYGDGTKQDIQKALECLDKSLKLGDTKAQKTIELIKDRYMPDKHIQTVTKPQEKSRTEKAKPLDKFRKQAKKIMSRKENTAPDKSKGGEAI